MNVFYISENNLLNDILDYIIKSKNANKIKFYKFVNIDELFKAQSKPDIIVLDVDFIDEPTSRKIKFLNNIFMYADILLISFHRDEVLKIINQSEVYDIIEKPVNINKMISIINKIYIERQLMYDFIMGENSRKSILFVVGRHLIWGINMYAAHSNSVVLTEKSIILYEEIEKYSINRFKNIFYSNIDLFNNVNIKKIIQTNNTIDQIEDKFLPIKNIYKYLIDNSFIISHKMS